LTTEPNGNVITSQEIVYIGWGKEKLHKKLDPKRKATRPAAWKRGHLKIIFELAHTFLY
jgi:hypothetical protein